MVTTTNSINTASDQFGNNTNKQEFLEKVKESKKYFPNSLAEFVYYMSYSRWLPEKGRRETWIETVDRYMDFMKENLGNKLTEQEYERVKNGIKEMRVVPSMRLLWSAGPAARATNVTAYNCAYLAVTKPEDLGEIMYISMCGAGVGFSVEKQFIENFPVVKMQTGDILPKYTIEDSKEGWAKAFVFGVKTWLDGKNVIFDFSQLRPKGARLKTMGGRSSGPEPLVDLIDFTRRKILSKQGQKLSTLDIHDICCKIGQIVVAGGVRRSAMISLSDLDDEEMRHAKEGQFYLHSPQRFMANNSAVYNQKPSSVEFLKEWTALASSGSGERGIFNRGGLKHQLPARRWETFRDYASSAGTNPCGEIVLRSKQFCNLSSIVARENDTLESLIDKIELATILGTYQSMLTDFKFLSPEWKKNCEEERLLGVSFTGLWDCPILRNQEVMSKLRDHAIEVNRRYAERFGINPSTCVTTVKPSGNSSQLTDTSSGLHTRHSPYYIRRVRISSTDPLFKMLKEQGFPFKPEVGQSYDNANTYVLEFPVKSPESAVYKNNISAIEQLEIWKMCKVNFTEHNPSVTISVGKDEWLEAGNWIYKNWDIIGGLAFLPKEEEDIVYELAPYETISKEQYEEMVSKLPEIDYSRLIDFELDDETNGAKEYACVGDKCEIV
ncbi:ribonucleoside-triphosphate reductase [Candidatus Dojkabacteria bacterium]|uniref:ribonucleoside-triphosphate reductase (thioredoxin) n=1 Tax=Candidatus Dojkabacteria bacterium TaxID=2099670 RepID=A0A3M0YZK4_9BACT|nr:MAG: ribonucleoside-triphosphate reductase [Candidatus Dojkabacteria bacterium]